MYVFHLSCIGDGGGGWECPFKLGVLCLPPVSQLLAGFATACRTPPKEKAGSDPGSHPPGTKAT